MGSSLIMSTVTGWTSGVRFSTEAQTSAEQLQTGSAPHPASHLMLTASEFLWRVSATTA